MTYLEIHTRYLSVVWCLCSSLSINSKPLESFFVHIHFICESESRNIHLNDLNPVTTSLDKDVGFIWNKFECKTINTSNHTELATSLLKQINKQESELAKQYMTLNYKHTTYSIGHPPNYYYNMFIFSRSQSRLHEHKK